MRAPANLGCMGCLGALGLFGIASTAIIWRQRSADVPLLEGLLGLLLSLPLALVLGLFSTAALVQLVMDQVWPSRVDVDAESLRFRMWHTWDGLLSGFRRVDTRLQRRDMEGVAFGTAQGGGCQLFVVHVSGNQFYAGFTGARPLAEQFALAILGSLAQADRP
ncbi:MAG: hypothetical protein K0R38_2022 [Polyangiaceae bacterium]|jgi:hypothetical protein|nr:hypothetical protein [Polyangiaceae bacterium]